MPIGITVEHSFPGFTLAASFDAPDAGITVLFGPSGAGKSTILASVAGLFPSDRTMIEIDGERIDRLAPERRRFGVVFQNGRLFPHLSVLDNLRYGQRRVPRRAGTPAGRLMLDDIVSLLGLDHLLRRRPAALSGGERQRVAVGRALLCQPRLLLMDEPLASLDDTLRGEILPYLIRLRDLLRLPMIYVTHAMDEVVRLADHVVLLEAGRVVARGSLPELASRIDLPLAMRGDAGGVLDGVVSGHDTDRQLTSVACGAAVFLVPLQDAVVRQAMRLLVPARDVAITLDTPRGWSVNNVVPAVVMALARDEAASAMMVELDVGGGTLLSRLTMDAVDRLRLRPGQRVLALIKSMSVKT